MAKKKPDQQVEPKSPKKSEKKAQKRIDELTAHVARLEAKIERLEGKAEEWKAEAKRHKAKRTELKRALQDATRKPAGGAVGPDTPVEGPDASWTVTRLRGLARERGIAGYSRKTKDQLLADLA